MTLNIFNGPFTLGAISGGTPPWHKMEPGKVYLQRNNDSEFNQEHNPETAGKIVAFAFRCPCGLPHTCGGWVYGDINGLTRDHFGGQSAWEVKVDGNNLVTIHPSILKNEVAMCDSHFFMNSGMILWCEPPNERPDYKPTYYDYYHKGEAHLWKDAADGG